jgi:hypothetical protein
MIIETSFNHSLEDSLKLFTWSLVINELSLMLILLALGSYLSSKVAGPIFAIKRFLIQTLDGERVSFRFRDGDDFKELEAPLSQLNEKLNAREVEEKEAA